MGNIWTDGVGGFLSVAGNVVQEAGGTNPNAADQTKIDALNQQLAAQKLQQQVAANQAAIDAQNGFFAKNKTTFIWVAILTVVAIVGAIIYHKFFRTNAKP